MSGYRVNQDLVTPALLMLGCSGHSDRGAHMQMTKWMNAIFLTVLLSSSVHAQTNAGAQKPDADLPFTVTQVATFDLPWRIAFLPDGRMLVTEKVGRLDLVTPQGAKTEVRGVPVVYFQGQNGMLGVFP